MKYNKNAIIEAIGGLKMLLHDFEKKATQRVPFKAMRHALATAIECCEKQIPKKPKMVQGFMTVFHCPICEGVIQFKQTYCDDCGQKLDWGD